MTPPLWWPVGNLAITRTDPLSKPSGTLRGAAHRGKPGERSLFPYPMFQPTRGTYVASTAGSMLAPTRCLSPQQGQVGLAEARLDAADPVAANTEQQGLRSASWGRVWPQSCHGAGVAAPPPWWEPRNPSGGLCKPERRHKIGLKRPAEAGPLPRGDLRYLTAQEVIECPLGCRRACLHHLELNLRPAVLTGKERRVGRPQGKQPSQRRDTISVLPTGLGLPARKPHLPLEAYL